MITTGAETEIVLGGVNGKHGEGFPLYMSVKKSFFDRQRPEL